MIKDEKYKSSSKELRFVTSAEQMLPFLDRIRGQSNDSDDPNDSDTNESGELNENNVVQASDNNNLSVPMVAPKISASNTSEALALPNIYEEYVNFIDLSVLNPIIDAKHCQRDRLIESEISEPNCLLFMFNKIAIKREFSILAEIWKPHVNAGAGKGLTRKWRSNVNEMNVQKSTGLNQFIILFLPFVCHITSYKLYDDLLAQLATVQ